MDSKWFCVVCGGSGKAIGYKGVKKERTIVAVINNYHKSYGNASRETKMLYE